MTLFDVYSLFDVTPVKAKGCKVWDEKGIEYLDLYGGHAVISVGHGHPVYVESIKEQLGKIGFYSNSVKNPLQIELARKLGEISGLESYSLFIVNSGAEANENALKLASFHTGKERIIAFNKSFHGRTSGAVSVTGNPKIISPFNSSHKVTFLDMEDLASVERQLERGDVAGVIIEGIQGVGGINIPSKAFLQGLSLLTKKYKSVLILDEVQSGYGRTGKFFAYQWADIIPDIVTIAKGMGNGFPVGGVLISPVFKASKGMLGTTFGGNYLAMAAANAVLDIIKDEKLLENAAITGDFLKSEIPESPIIKGVRGKGLMLGIEFSRPVSEIRHKLLFDKHVFTGVSGTDIIRLLPPLTLSKSDAADFIKALKEVI